MKKCFAKYIYVYKIIFLGKKAISYYFTHLKDYLYVNIFLTQIIYIYFIYSNWFIFKTYYSRTNMNKVFNLSIIVFFILMIFNIDKILKNYIFFENSYFIFFISFLAFCMLYLKSIYSAFKYEIFVKESKQMIIIHILKILSILYYLTPFLMALIVFYDYLMGNVAGGLIIVSTFIYMAFILKKIFKF